VASLAGSSGDGHSAQAGARSAAQALLAARFPALFHLLDAGADIATVQKSGVYFLWHCSHHNGLFFVVGIIPTRFKRA